MKRELPFREIFYTGFFVALLTSVLAPAQAAVVTTNESGMDDIFSQPSFGTHTIDIRFTPTFTLRVDPSLLRIDDDAELSALFDMAPSASPIANMFFVDAINFCGGVSGPSIIGCGNQPGNRLAVESGVAASSNGAALNAHELGHNLGLSHVGTSGTNLMNPFGFGNTTLDASQVNTILMSGLVQTDANGRFIQITPILVSAVPVPATLPLALSALSVLGLIGRRRQAA